ncbi:FG-GAP-like repeat-containing protein [Caulobacter sp. NIBR2454]|uniref:FG-GAP-like repeat-containing protein n=1 Tax=Caulobacter sp. NIBR2454 TaxID=3015996 RepID=UPI0022B63ED8|nr:FG-GAP-like repeat-containing protein [Caulobacter sp. NIBR2454]
MAAFTSRDFTLPVRAGFATAYDHEIAIADFNGDGRLDVVLSYFLYPLEDRAVPIRILAGDGRGGFTDATTAIVGAQPPVTVHGRQIVVADLNKDGRSDAFFADHGYDAAPFPGARNALLLSSGATSSIDATGRLPTLKDFSHSAAAGDIDGDGDIDLYVGNYNGGAEEASYFLLNDGAANFTLSRGGLPTDLATAQYNSPASLLFDADADGDLDLLVTPNNTHAQSARILKNDGKGGFSQALSSFAMPKNGALETVIDAKAADLNADGRLDLVLTTVVDLFKPGTTQIWINDGAGSFRDETAQRLPSQAAEEWRTRTQVADLNGDGAVDLLFSNGASRPVFFNDGTGKFTQAAASYLPGAQQYDKFHAADLNGDGRMDIFAIRGLYNGVEQFRVYLAEPPAPPNAAIVTAASSILRTTSQAMANDLSAKISAGTLTQAAAVAEIVKAADATTSVATLSYLFFTGKIPGSAGIDYLVSPTGPNANNLNSAYFQSFNLENRYINFAVNLGRDGEGKAAFQAEYGGLNLFDATKKAYGEIFGGTPTDAKVTALLSGGRDAYFASYGGDGLTGQGTKAAMVGWLLAEAEKGDLGVMARTNAAWLTDLADGSAPFAIDITAASAGYYKPDFVFGG